MNEIGGGLGRSQLRMQWNGREGKGRERKTLGCEWVTPVSGGI
jgi:hypothetical protein